MQLLTSKTGFRYCMSSFKLLASYFPPIYLLFNLLSESLSSRGNREREACRQTLDKIGVMDLVEEKHYHLKKLSMNTWIRFDN